MIASKLLGNVGDGGDLQAMLMMAVGRDRGRHGQESGSHMIGVLGPVPSRPRHGLSGPL